MAEFSVQSDAEYEVREALAKYNQAKLADSALTKTEAYARAVVRLSEDHRRHPRLITSQQPVHVRDQDRFLSLLD